MLKKNVLVLFGGCSTEHEVSKVSAYTVMANISEEKYNVIPVYITREGKWLLYDGAVDNLRNVPWEKFGTAVVLSPDRVNRGLLRIVGDKVKYVPVDVVFPVLHGKNGEDGSLQGLLELGGLPYVGCGVLSSAICMDKTFTKIIAQNLGLKQADYIVLNMWDEASVKAGLRKMRKIGYPCFVKPASTGSSVGISKANDKKELLAAIDTAKTYDDKVIIERGIVGRELECSVLGWRGDVSVSVVGEVIAAGEFYDYSSKYDSDDSKTIFPADLPEEISEEISSQSIRMFNAVDGRGLARVDFFWEETSGSVIFNEINTMPGFTSISMYPKLWQASSIGLPDLIDRLIEIALR
ncbi:MAG: D-alanine--D-alanine ligase [Clostridiales bacterium]|nr:D-alanine--D-alanine ligase [Clostridiales bacterium]